MTSKESKENSYTAWSICCRPKTWGISLSPVVVGLVFSFWHLHDLNWSIALATALLSILMQTISNMENDAAYTKRKAERTNRKGLPRATSLGLLSIQQVEKAIFFLIGLTIIDTGYLLYQGGWIIVLISLSSVIAAYFYMGGSKPLAYTPFSEIVCFTFFGLIAVGGTFFLQTKTLELDVVLAGCAVGSLASAVLVVNNYRDIHHDRSVQRNTLAVVIGRKKTRQLYACLLYLPFLICILITALSPTLFPIVATLLLLPKCRNLVRDLQILEGNQLNSVLFSTVKLELLFSLLLSSLIVFSAFLQYSLLA